MTTCFLFLSCLIAFWCAKPLSNRPVVIGDNEAENLPCPNHRHEREPKSSVLFGPVCSILFSVHTLYLNSNFAMTAEIGELVRVWQSLDLPERMYHSIYDIPDNSLIAD